MTATQHPLLAPEPENSTPGAEASWLADLRQAADDCLPAHLTLTVPWKRGELSLTLVRECAEWDPEELRYVLGRSVTVTGDPGYPDRTLQPGSLSFTGWWMSVPGLPAKMCDDLHTAVATVRDTDPDLDRILHVLELRRVVLLRQRTGGRDLGIHRDDVTELQADLAPLLAAADQA